MQTQRILTILGVILSIVCGTIQADAAMRTPDPILAFALSSNRITVSWNDSNLLVTGFRVERSLRKTTGFKLVAKLNGGGLRSYQDHNLQPNTTYYYRVRSVEGASLSRRSEVAGATTFASEPIATVTATPIPTSTATRTAVPTSTATVTSTAVPTTIATATATTTATTTPLPTRTATAVPTTTATATPVPTRTATATLTAVPTLTATATALPTATRTSTPVPTATPAGAPAGPFAKRFGGASSDIGQATAIDGHGNIIVTGLMNGSADFGGATLTSAGGGADVVLAKYSPAGAHLWSKRIGYLWDDQGFGVAVDLSPNCDGVGGTDCVVVTGSFTSTVDFGSGSALESAGSTDMFVAKYSSSGAYLWAKRQGGINADYGYAVSVDARPNCDGSGNANVSGCILVTGTFMTAIDVDGVALSGPLGVASFFVEKLSPSGARVWARTYGNTNQAFGRGIAVDDAGDVAVTGSFQRSVDFGNGIRPSFGGDDIFVAKLRGTDGSGVWSNRYGSDGVDKGLGVAFDAEGNVSVTGVFGFMSGNVTFGGQSWAANGTDIFVAQLDGATGAHRWSRRCTGSYTNVRQGSGIATDLDGNVAITGHFAGSLNCGTDTPTLTGAGYSDVLVAKFSATGGSVWMKRFGVVGGSSFGRAVAIDPVDDYVVSTGAIQGRVDVDGQSLQSAGAEDVFLVRSLP